MASGIETIKESPSAGAPVLLLCRGLEGAAGAVPGTLAAHPFDVLKMHQQVFKLSIAGALRKVNASKVWYKGVGAAVTQKVTTRGPMFLLSEGATLAVMRLGVSRDKAVWTGSLLSGYLTGILAGPAEWRKVRSAVLARKSEVGVKTFEKSNVLSRGGLVKIHGAGLRNALFDSTFFGLQHFFQASLGWPSWLAYGSAAALAVFVDYPLDVVVKRAFAAEFSTPVQPPLRAALQSLREQRSKTFLGLGAKGSEFFISYAVTGAFASLIFSQFSS